MKTAMKKLFSLMLVAALLVCAIPFQAFATVTDHRVDFYGADGQWANWVTVADGDAIPADAFPSVTVPDGYKLVWEGAGATYVPGETPVYADVTIGPELVPVDYTVEFYNGDTWLANIKVNADGKIVDGSVPAAPTVLGQKFVGWYHSAGQYVPGVSKISGNLVVGAKYETVSQPTTPTTPTNPSNPATTYAVSFYDVNGSLISTVNVAANGNVHISNVQDAASKSNVGTGYTFSGWKIGSTGSTTFSNADVSNLQITGNTSFYAVAAQNSTSGGGNTGNNKFPYKVYLHIYRDNKVDTPAKTIDITNGIALDGKVTLAEVKSVVKNYYTAKTSDGIQYDGLYLARGNWVNNFVNDSQKYDDEPIEDTNEMRKESEVHINVMITNASTKSSSSATADTTNPKTGDNIYMVVTVMGLSAAALAAVYYVSKKRAF